MGLRSSATSCVTMLLTSRPLPMPGDERVAMNSRFLRFFGLYRHGSAELEGRVGQAKRTHALVIEVAPNRVGPLRLTHPTNRKAPRRREGPFLSQGRSALEQLQHLLRQLVGLRHH